MPRCILSLNAPNQLKTTSLLLCLASLTACSATHPAQSQPTAAPIAIVHARSATLSPERTLAGFIAPLQTVTLSTTLNEPAATVPVIEGERVHTGELLAQFDVSDLQANLLALERSANAAEAGARKQQFQSVQTISQGLGSDDQAHASLRQAQAKLEQDQRDLQRETDLLAHGYIAQQTVDQQRTTVVSDQQAVASAEAALRAAHTTVTTNGSLTQGLQGASIAAEQANAAAARAQADQIRAQISRATITSPVEGTLLNRNLNPGEYPNGRTLFTIAQNGVTYAVLNAAAAQIVGVHPGQSATVRLDNHSYAAHIVAVLGQTTPGSTNFTIKATIDQPDERFVSGLPIEATIHLTPITGICVPRSSFLDATENQVIAVTRNVAHLAQVNVVAETPSQAIVSGITPGQAIVRDGNTGIADGQTITTTPGL